MKIVVIGGSGLIGTKLVQHLRQRGHEVVAAVAAPHQHTWPWPVAADDHDGGGVPGADGALSGRADGRVHKTGL